MLGSVKPNSLELRADSFIAATACPEIFLVQVSPKSNYILQLKIFAVAHLFLPYLKLEIFCSNGFKANKGQTKYTILKPNSS